MRQEEKDKLHKAADEYANSIAQHYERKTYCVEDFIAGAKWADLNYMGRLDEDYAWKVYQFVNEWKMGEYGEVPLQKAIIENFKDV